MKKHRLLAVLLILGCMINVTGCNKNTVRVASSTNIQKKAVEAKEINDSNSYKVIYSTLNKLVGFRTADNNGEATTYEKMLDTKNGVDILVLDGFGNSIILNSTEGGLNISTNTHVTINTVHANISASETCNIDTKIANISASDSTTIKTGVMTIISDRTDINP